MSRVENVIKFYMLCNKLKDVIRSGWLTWHIKKERVESVAEHIYSTEMLAIAMKSEYQIDIDLEKVIFMLAIHELEEIIIGDIEMTAPDYATKTAKGHVAIHEILKDLIDGEKLENLILEFDERKTKESYFAYQCDKLECDLQAKLYDEQGYVSFADQQDNYEYNSEMAQELIKNGAKGFSTIWLATDEKLYPNNNEFKEVFEYIKNNDITSLINKD